MALAKHRRTILAAIGAAATFLAPALSPALEQPPLSNEEKRRFLLTADVIRSEASQKGVTGTWRLTLSDGQRTHDACFQSVDIFKLKHKLPDGRIALNFRDSYKYNIAAFELAELLGLVDLIPVTVERKWKGKPGSLSWWITSVGDEKDRIEKGIRPPDVAAWTEEVATSYVFTELIRDTDRNQTNILYTEDGKIWLIDFSRAFRKSTKIRDPVLLSRCERGLFEQLQTVKLDMVEHKLEPFLTPEEIQALCTRRDLIIAHFKNLIAQKGEEQVLYCFPREVNCPG
jgi:hypothetical protein